MERSWGISAVRQGIWRLMLSDVSFNAEIFLYWFFFPLRGPIPCWDITDDTLALWYSYIIRDLYVGSSALQRLNATQAAQMAFTTQASNSSTGYWFHLEISALTNSLQPSSGISHNCFFCAYWSVSTFHSGSWTWSPFVWYFFFFCKITDCHWFTVMMENRKSLHQIICKVFFFSKSIEL